MSLFNEKESSNHDFPNKSSVVHLNGISNLAEDDEDVCQRLRQDAARLFSSKSDRFEIIQTYTNDSSMLSFCFLIFEFVAQTLSINETDLPYVN